MGGLSAKIFVSISLILILTIIQFCTSGNNQTVKTKKQLDSDNSDSLSFIPVDDSVDIISIADSKFTLSSLKEQSRKALIKNCGKCHQPGRSTSKEGAMAVFNLDEDIWYSNMGSDEFESLLDRVNGSLKFEKTEKIIIDSLVTLVLESNNWTSH